jgi:hypothetical protein
LESARGETILLLIANSKLPSSCKGKKTSSILIILFALRKQNRGLPLDKYDSMFTQWQMKIGKNYYSEILESINPSLKWSFLRKGFRIFFLFSLGSAESLICLSGEFPVVPILVISYIP